MGWCGPWEPRCRRPARCIAAPASWHGDSGTSPTGRGVTRGQRSAHLRAAGTTCDHRRSALASGGERFLQRVLVPARSKYQAERPATAAVAGILASYGDDDPDWMGSHVYRDAAGFYESLRPTKQIPGWAYNAARDTEYDPASRHRPAKSGGMTVHWVCARS